MRRMLDGLYAISGWAAALFIVAIAALVAAQVGLNLAEKVLAGLGLPRLGLTIPSYADFTGFFLAAASFLALAGTFRAGGHIRVTLLTARLGGAAGRAVEVVAVALAAAATLFFTWFTALLVLESREYGDMSSGMVAVPIWIPQSAMLAGLAVLSVALIDELAGLLRGAPPSYAGKGEDLLADPARGE